MFDRIAIIKTGWSKDYRGAQVVGNYSYDHPDHEKVNFLPGPDGRYFCYVPPIGGNKKFKQFGSAPKPKNPDGWLVFAVSRNPDKGGLYVVGWYEDAHFLHRHEVRPEYKHGEPWFGRGDDPHVMLKDIANNAEIDVIWDKWQEQLEPLRADLNQASGNDWKEWEIPREPEAGWSSNVSGVHKAWWDARIARQREIDASIARAADVEYLYDKPYTDNSRVRVAGPFTVESLSPHRIVPADAEELVDQIDAEAHGMEGGKPKKRGPLSNSETDFAAMVIEHLKTAGVHQTDKADRIAFTSLTPFAGRGYIAAEGRFMEGETERRAAIFIGPEFGTLSRVDLTAAAREAAESRFDVLIAVSFAFDAHASELTRLGPLPILKAKMNPDLHMSEELKNTGKGNLFTVFGEPDIDILEEPDGRIAVRVNGVDIYDPNTGEVRSNDVKGIAAWFIDTAYNEESFFVRHAYFLGANDPYKQLKTTLKAEIDEEAWATLNRATSRPFDRPESGRIAVKVINHFGDEVMKVFGV